MAAYYARLGFHIYFTAAQGDCAPDSIALDLGFGSTPLVWKQIRAEVADSMFDLRHTHWFRECFQACQEFDDAVDDAPSEDSAPTRDTDDEQDVNTMHESMNCEGLSAAKPPLLHQELPDRGVRDNSDNHRAAMSAKEVMKLLDARKGKDSVAVGKVGKGVEFSKRKYAATLLSTRHAIGRLYNDWLGDNGLPSYCIVVVVVFSTYLLTTTQASPDHPRASPDHAPNP